MRPRHICDDPTCPEPVGHNDDHRCGGDMGTDIGCGEYFCGIHILAVDDLPPQCVACFLQGFADRAHDAQRRAA